MKRFHNFWKRDIINKLIVLTALALLAGMLAFAWMLINMPQGMSLSKAFSGFLPGTATPTLDVNANPGTPTRVSVAPPKTNTPLRLPTFTPLPPVETIIFPSPAVELTVSPLDITGTPTPNEPGGTSCIPNNPRQIGKAIDVLDGNTIKVLIDGLVYVVRYIGISAPDQDDPFGRVSALRNGDFVFFEEITLIGDVSDKDDRGRLLRYVVVGDIFVNLELIKEGLATAKESPPDSSCATTFKDAEQIAISSRVGMWEFNTP